ncbi:MAG: hypothetical protein K1X92_18590 [Bacteroidia bacterium]|nr:hypothetical protein [Bacteroidia bacterium]
MKNSIFLLLSVIWAFSCTPDVSEKKEVIVNAPKEIHTPEIKPIVSDSVVYAFINYMIRECDRYQMKNQYAYVAEDSREGNFFLGEDSLKVIKSGLFTRNDLSGFYQQTRERSNFRLDSTQIKIFSVIPESKMKQFEASPDFWASYHKSYHTGYCTYSLPLFSKDLKTVVLKNKWLFDGLGGAGELAVYQRSGNSWKKVKVLSYWES